MASGQMEDQPVASNSESPENYTVNINPKATSDEDMYRISSPQFGDETTTDLGRAIPSVFAPGFKIFWSQLPQPMPFFGALGGYGPGRGIPSIMKHCVMHAKVAGRPLSMDECNALAYHTSKVLAIGSYGVPLGTAAGTTRAYLARDTYSFPFFKPDLNKLNPNRFLGFRGVPAQLAWHGARFIAYGAFGGIIGQYVFATYSALVGAVNARNDPRMGQFWRDAKDSKDWHQAKQPEERFNTVEPNTSISYDSSQFELDSSGGRPDAQFGTMTDSQVSSQNQPPDFGFDDASPVAPSAPPVDTSASAWERLRRGQRPSSTPPPQQQQHQQPTQPSEHQQRSPGGEGGDAWARARQRGYNTQVGYNSQDNYSPQSNTPRPSPTGDDLASYNDSEAERQRAQEQAQREFDARLDRERQGHNFDDENDRRWK